MNIFLIFLLTIGLIACGFESRKVGDNTPIEPNSDQGNDICEDDDGINWQALLTTQCQKLSDYNLFTDSSEPRSGQRIGGLSYQLNSQLFTDHARKYRYVFMPPNTQATFVDAEVLEFPVGSVFVKVFALPEDTGKPEENIIEVRLMIHRPSGWVGLPYVWDKQEQEGYLDFNGETVPFTMLHKGVVYEDYYTVPTYGSCRNCHQYNGAMTLIGPKARLLNKQIVVEGESVNQLVYWQVKGLLAEGGLPSNILEVEFAPDWRDETKNLTDRAKAYLDINCAHCHRPEGSASLSGLKVEFGRKNIDHDHGVCNSAHGWRGGGFDIWPGDSGNSSMPLRMTLSGAPDRMPPLGRSLIDEDAVELIRQWIDAMPYKECAEQNN
jgi:uncharacterized repeat protein (TIGR03806 family)